MPGKTLFIGMYQYFVDAIVVFITNVILFPPCVLTLFMCVRTSKIVRTDTEKYDN